MKITSVTTFAVPPRWSFVRIETDDGLVGWGEAVLEGRAESVRATVAELADYVVGRDPRQIEDIWTVLYRGGFYRGGGIHMSALAGIDQALWDITARHHGVPVHALLGGRVRERMAVYSWIGGDRPAETAASAKAAVARGFRAVKMNGTEELQYLDSWAKIERCLENVAAVRDAVGPDVGIGVDFHGRVHKPMAKVLLRELEPYRLMFVEEPVLSEHVDAVADVLRASPIPIALAACLQIDAATYNATIQEQSLGIHYNTSNDLLDYLRDPAVFSYDDGFVAIPDGPGLGIEVNEEYVRERAAEGHRWRNPVWRHADGSFAEW